MHELQSLLLKKIPRLGELTFWCEVMTPDRRIVQVLCTDPEVKVLYNKNTEYLDYQYEILWHPFTHADILEALGEDWAITGSWELLFYPRWHTSIVFWMDMWPQWIEKGITLPSNISDLSLPEYEETRARLISLLK